MNISISGGEICQIDAEDLEKISKFIWKAHYVRRDGRDAVSGVVTSVRGKPLRIHRLLLGISDPKIEVDHRDKNPLNNQRVNLRVASRMQNAQNRRIASHNRSGFKGVYFRADRRKKYVAEIRANKIKHCLGAFDTPQEAHLAYCKAAAELHGEFASFT